MTLTPAIAIDAAAAALALAGVAVLLRLRTARAGTPAAYAVRIGGTMLLMLGLILIVFTTSYALAACA